MRLKLAAALTLVFLMSYGIDYAIRTYQGKNEVQRANTTKESILKGFDGVQRITDPLFQEVVIELIKPEINPIGEHLPFQHAGGGFVSRRHRVMTMVGNQHPGFMPDDWQQAMAMAMFGKEELYESKAPLFLSIPVTKAQMLEFNNEFRLISIRRTPCLFWYGLDKDIMTVILYRMDLISEQDILDLVREKIRVKHPKITGTLNSLTLPVSWFPGTTFLYSILGLILLALIGYFVYPLLQRLLFHFELRLLIVMLFSSLVVYLPFWFLHTVAYDTEFKNLKLQWERQSFAEIRQLEESWPRWETEYLENLRNTFHSGSRIETLLPKGYTSVFFDGKNPPIHFPKDIEILPKAILNNFAPWIIPNLAHSGFESLEEVQNHFPVENPLFRRIMLPNEVKSSASILNDSGNGIAHQLSLVGNSYHVIWLASKPDQAFRFQLSVYFTSELQKQFLHSLPNVSHRYILSGGDWIKGPPPSDTDHVVFTFVSQSLGNTKWIVHIPESRLYASLYRMDFWFHILTFLFFATALFLSLVLSRILMQPVNILRHGLQELLANRFSLVSSRGLHPEGKLIVDSFNTMSEVLEERQRISPYVPAALIGAFTKIQESHLLQSECVLLVSDIRGFTTISESHDPEEVVAILNAYFSLWQEQVDKHQGIVIRYIGDAIVAVFLKDTSPNYRQDATETALAVHNKLQYWNRERLAHNQIPIKNGCGLALGELKLGIIGTEAKREFLALGGMLERAEELEVHSKNGLSTCVLCDKNLMEHLKNQYDFTPVGTGFEIIA
ncbi:MAG: adenylate/guanylate cyclase domain-containing protein [Candidatus Cloacimonetes bacterium]|nr:adenylate/guanylate cyclase domain-containing protein [Candidatus Cloacimonadota bacterium]